MYDLGKKTSHFQRKFGKWVKNIFLYMKFIKKLLWGLGDVLPQFSCSVALFFNFDCVLTEILASEGVPFFFPRSYHDLLPALLVEW